MTNIKMQGPAGIKNHVSKPTSETKKKKNKRSTELKNTTTRSIIERTRGSINQRSETCHLRHHRSRPQIGNATIGRQKVGILGILHGLTTREISVQTSFGWPGDQFPTTDGWCRQNTHSHDTFVHVQRITERIAQVQSLITRTRVTQVVRHGVFESSLSSQRHVSCVAVLATEHFYTISLACLPTTFSLTVLSFRIGSRNPARFTAKWRIPFPGK